MTTTTYFKQLMTAGLLSFCGMALWAAPAAENAPAITAKWIWKAQPDYNRYNQTILARKSFTLEQPRQAVLYITADSFYRLRINGQWVNDGPCRSWPQHFQYDVINAASYLVSGENQIEIVARYFGVGDFHHVPQQAGLLAQLDVTLASGKVKSIISDHSWEIAEADGWVVNTPKQSIQMEPFEIYDARQAGDPKFSRARELYEFSQGPWKDVKPRDVALLTRQPVSFKAFGGAHVVKCEGWNFCLPAVRLMHPGLIEANINIGAPCGMACLLQSESGCAITLEADLFKVAIDGQPAPNDKEIKLSAGSHLVVAFVRTLTGHEKEKTLRFMNPQGFKLVNPLDPKHENPWCFLKFNEFNFATNDLHAFRFFGELPEFAAKQTGYVKLTDQLLREVKTTGDFEKSLKPRAEQMASKAMFVLDPTWQFQHRQVIGDASSLVKQPQAMMFNTPEMTTVNPSSQGDVELMCDLGVQDIGYYSLDMIAPAGVEVDIFGIEYITPDGRLQHTGAGYRNGMRYITREGLNHFVSLKRRSGRYLYLTLHNQKAPVQIRNFSLIESTYPVNAVGGFHCSDARLDEIWAISTRTLKLCMEDTFTDCPLYEQTHWVGDARNESLMAYPVFGATDIGRRCIKITAQSLEHYPIAGCQTPSGWDVLLPAWSFLWGMSTWDYYWYSGDEQFLREIYPDVIRNLKGAEKCVNDRNLFSGPYWNMFDWSGADQNQKTVLHNTMFMVGAIDVALKEAEVLHDSSHTDWLKALRQRLVGGVNSLWDEGKKAYPDSIHDDGSVSASTCQHTSFLSILYDIVSPANRAAAQENTVNPPEKMVRLGSPFAGLYLLETLEKLGLEDRIVEEIYHDYLPMLETGATTVWESFATGTTGHGGFPTRSHCHAWSSAPSYFLNRIVLGVRPTAAGGQAVSLSPHLSNLTWANGSVATIKGPISVSWKVAADKSVAISCQAPEGVIVKFETNASLAGRTVTLNGQKVQ